MHIYMTDQSRDQLLECQPTDQSREFWIPNIPSSYFITQDAGTFRTSEEHTLDTADKDTYVFTIPAESAERNCSGNVLAIQYCYEARSNDYNDDIKILDILLLVRDDFHFTVNSSFPVEASPNSAICVDPDDKDIDRVCCDTLTLDPNIQSLTIPPSSFTIGYTVVDNNVRPLQFVDTITAYQADRFVTGGTPSAGDTFMLESDDREVGPILLLRFLIGICIYT